MNFFFNFTYKIIKKYRFSTILTLMSIILGCFFFIQNITLQDDILKIIPKNEKSELTSKVLKQLNFSDKIIILIQSQEKNDQNLPNTAQLFLEKIKPFQSEIKKIQGNFTPKDFQNSFHFIYENLPLFLSEKDYTQLEQKITPNEIKNTLENQINKLSNPNFFQNTNIIKKDPLDFSFLGFEKFKKLNINENFSIENGFLTSNDKKNIILLIESKHSSTDTSLNQNLIQNLEKITNTLNQKNPKIKTFLYGSPIIAHYNALQIKDDIQKTTLISFSILLLILIFYFRNFWVCILLFIPTIFAGFISLTLIYFLKGEISAISLGISAIILGITLDFPLHILTHYQKHQKIKDLYQEITKPIIISGLTTSISFFCLIFVQSEALKDLGIFSGIAVFLSAIFSLILIPAFYTPKKNIQTQNHLIDKISHYPYEKNKIIIISSIIFCVLGLLFFNQIQFNKNIEQLNYTAPHLRKAKQELEKISHFSDKSIYLIAYGNDLNQNLNQNTKLYHFLEKEKNTGKIQNFSSVGDFILSKEKQNEKIKIWNDFWQKNKDKTFSTLHWEGKNLGFAPSTFDDYQKLLNKKISPLDLEKFHDLQNIDLKEFISEKNNFFTISTQVKIEPKYREEFLSKIENFPGVIAIDRTQINENLIGFLKEDFSKLLNYSLFVIFITLLFSFKSWGLSLLTMIPILLTGLTTAGILYLLNIELNILSLVVCTLVFGVGDDFSIFLTQAMQKEHTYGKNHLPLYRKSIFLAVLTTILSIGALIFAQHPALKSLAIVALIGMLTIVIITTSLYPFLFRFLIINRQKKGLSPITLRLLIHSLFSFLYYGLVGILFSTFGGIFIKKMKTKNLHKIKKIIAFFLKSVLYSNPFVRKKVFNPQRISHPSLIIANHTSFLDTLTLALATDKVIYLVNDWVYRSPIFGKLVKSLGFYPVSKGIEGAKEMLLPKIKQGFSIVIFPEGARSDSNHIQRFHKGAFLLAEELKLDITPIYIHGNSEVLPKGDFIIYDGSMSVFVGEKIPYNASFLGQNYSEKTKKINQIFRQNFNEIRNQIEDENYFQKLLFLSFLYKEESVVKSIKNEFKTHKSLYFKLHQILSSEQKIAHISDGYGLLDFFLSLYDSQRKIFTYIKDENKKLVAENHYLTQRRKILFTDNLDFFLSKKTTILIISTSEIIWENFLSFYEKIIFLFPEKHPYLWEKINFYKDKINFYKQENLVILQHK